MTRYLLDTHLIYWWMTRSVKLSKSTSKLIGREMCSISVASLWELQLKQATGKLALPKSSLQSQFAQQGFSLLPVTANHVERAHELGGLKSDPFDMLLVAVADIERMTLLTKDTRLLSLGLKHIHEA